MKNLTIYLLHNLMLWSLLIYPIPSPSQSVFMPAGQPALMGASGYPGSYGAGFGAGMGLGMSGTGASGGLPFMGGTYGASGFGQTGFAGSGMGYGMNMAAIGMQVSNDITKLTNDMKIKQELLAVAAKEAPPPLKTQSKFFPECKTAPAKFESESLLKCERNYIRDEITQMRALKTMEIARAKAEFFDTASMVVEGDEQDFGIQCIENEHKKLKDQMAEFIEQLRNQTRNISELSNDLITKMKGELTKVDTLHKQLVGGPYTTEKGDVRNYFKNPSCLSIVDSTTMSSGTGILKILDQVKSHSGKSGQLSRSIKSGEINRLIRQDLEQLKDKSGKDVELTSLNFPGVGSKNLLGRDESKMRFDYDQIKERLKNELNITIEEDFKTFERSREVDINNSQKKYLYKQEIKKTCFQEVSTSVADRLVPIGDDNIILPSEQNITLQKFVNDVKLVIGNTSYTIDEQIAEIKQLEQGKNFKTRYSNLYGKKAQEQYWKVSDVLESQNSYCDEWYEKQPISPSSPYSRKDLLETNLRDLGQIRRKLSQTGGRIEEYVNDQLLKCKGIPDPVTRPASCPGILDTQSANFCVPFAKKCINNVNRCLSRANKIKKNVEKKMKAYGNKYNRMAENLIKIHNAELKKSVNETKSLIKAMSKQFPGSSYQLPGNLSVALPGYGNQKYGVNLINDADLNFFADREKGVYGKLKALEDNFKKHQQKLDQEVTQRVNNLKTQYSKEQQKWNELAKKCQGEQQAFIQRKQQQMQMQYQQQMQQQQALSEYCSSKQMARVYPGCEGQAQSLTQQMGQVMLKMPALGYGSMAMSNQYSQVCNQLATSQMRPPAEQNPLMAQLLNVDQGRDYVGLCDSAGGTATGITKVFRQNMERNSWQFAAVLKAKYPSQFGNIQGENIASILSPGKIQSVAQPVTGAQGNQKIVKEVTQISGIPVSELNKTSVGQYLVALANMEINIQGNDDFCREIQQKKSTYKETCKKEVGSGAAGSGGIAMGVDASAIQAQQQALPQCIKNYVMLEIQDTHPHIPIILSHVNTLSDAQKNVVYDMSEAMSQKMGETPDMACAAQFLMPRTSPMGPGMQGGMGGMGPMTQGVRSF